MKHFVILISCLFFLAAGALAQEENGDIVMKKNIWGVKYSLNGKRLRPVDVLEILKTNDKAYTQFRKAKGNYDMAQVLGFVGGALIGWPVGEALGGGDPAWGLAAAGVGVVLLSIPFSTAYSRRAATAINLYNSGPEHGASAVSIHLIPYGTGAKLLLRF